MSERFLPVRGRSLAAAGEEHLAAAQVLGPAGLQALGAEEGWRRVREGLPRADRAAAPGFLERLYLELVLAGGAGPSAGPLLGLHPAGAADSR